MKIIRDEECGGIMMIPLLIDWKINRCNVRDCREKPNTIIAGAGDGIPVFGLCEKHFQDGNVPGGCHYDLIFDASDLALAGSSPIETHLLDPAKLGGER